MSNTSGAPAPVTVAVQWATELEDAVQHALGAWLENPAAGLGFVPATQQPAIGVFFDWPEPDVKLAMPRVTVLRAGEPDVQDFDPTLTSDAPVYVSGNVSQYRWIVGHAEQPMQIEVWASSKAMRGDALARLRVALTTGMDVTLAAYFASLTPAQQALLPASHDPVDNELTLQLPAPWATTLASYYFEKARLYESPNASGEREWRATFSGSAYYEITRVAASAALARVTTQAALTTGDLAAATANPAAAGGPFQTTVTLPTPGSPTSSATYSR